MGTFVASYHHHQLSDRCLRGAAAHWRVEYPEPESVGCFLADLSDLLRRHRAVAHDNCSGGHGVRCTSPTEQHLTCAIGIEDARGEELQASTKFGYRVRDDRRSMAERFERLLTTGPHHRLKLSALCNSFGDRAPLTAQAYEADSHQFGPGPISVSRTRPTGVSVGPYQPRVAPPNTSQKRPPFAELIEVAIRACAIRLTILERIPLRASQSRFARESPIYSRPADAESTWLRPPTRPLPEDKKTDDSSRAEAVRVRHATADALSGLLTLYAGPLLGGNVVENLGLGETRIGRKLQDQLVHFGEGDVA